MSDNSIDWNLLRKVRNHTANAREREAFEAWLQADPRHRAYYERMLREAEIRRAAKPLPLDETFGELRKALVPQPVVRRSSFLLRYAAVAAVIVLCVAGVVWQQSRNDVETERVCDLLAREYHPASDRALLIVDDVSYSLGEGAELDLDIAGGRIATEGSERLNYSADDEARAVQNRLVVPRGGFYSVRLEDGTVVTLNAESELIYPSVFDAHDREVTLRGEAFFEVVHDAARPFYVRVDGYRIQVLGTRFNVSAYGDEPRHHTTLVEGSVRILEEDSRTVCREIQLCPGEQFSRDVATSRSMVTRVDTSRYTAWMEGEFVFDNTPLGDVLRTVSRWYDFRYEITDPALEKYTFSGQISMKGTSDYLFRVLHEAYIPVTLRFEEGILYLDKR